MKFSPCGTHHLLVESDSLDEVLNCFATLESDPPEGVLDLLPAARTVLVEYDRDRTTYDALSSAIAGTQIRRRTDRGAPATEIPVRYDGEDVAFVQDFLGFTRDQLVEWHTGQTWRVAFTGFAPGFGYMVGDLEDRPVPRLEEPRVDVPAGAVALAGEFTGIYPRSSPGGWRIVGHTDAVLWDLRTEPPALLVPGGLVQFVEVP
ncbi:allophanate hydrolase subunit 1 [Aeromicrobium sp. Root472D3]|uniref:5-oxoprolinase subunit B family protein n=1 Tax=Aeromicrobium sp. Root472D3 TaxID=1736540 RepID=UPI0006F2DAF2|nr:allophanate hydrolase subunit 1 [Aeromicrobium sp. Root472D3]KQX74199.1 allophanate hydrolase [Aeromicrobium sp. Root472D3]